MRLTALVGEHQTSECITPEPVLRGLKLFAYALFDHAAGLVHDTTRANGM
jgi:hypothetical protein